MTIVVQLQLCRFYFLAKRVDDIISIYRWTSMEVIWYIRNTFRAVKSKLTFRRIVFQFLICTSIKNLYSNIPRNGRHPWLDVIRFIIVSLVCVSFVHYIFVVQCIFVQRVSFGHMTDRLVIFKPFVLVSMHPYWIGTFHAVLVGVRYTARSSDKFRVWRSFNKSE